MHGHVTLLNWTPDMEARLAPAANFHHGRHSG